MIKELFESLLENKNIDRGLLEVSSDDYLLSNAIVTTALYNNWVLIVKQSLDAEIEKLENVSGKDVLKIAKARRAFVGYLERYHASNNENLDLLLNTFVKIIINCYGESLPVVNYDPEEISDMERHYPISEE